MSSSEVATLELQSLIGKWRKLIAQLKEENVLLDQARETAAVKEAEYRGLISEWEATKNETQDAVMKVTAEITASRNEVAALEAQTASLNNRIAQRQEKTSQYKTILAAKKAEVEENKERIFAEEEGVRQRLATFRSCRAELKAELEMKSEKVSESLKREEAAFAASEADMEKKIRQLEAAVVTEKKQWAAEKDRLDKEDKIKCLVALRGEISDAQKSKSREVSFLKDSASLKTNIEQSANEIESLLANLRIEVR